MKNIMNRIYTFLIVGACWILVCVFYFWNFAIGQEAELKKATDLIGEVEKNGDITDSQILEKQQKNILKELESLKSLPVIPSSKNASRRISSIQKLQSLLPPLQENIKISQALKTAANYAVTAANITNGWEKGDGELYKNGRDPDCEKQMQGYNLHMAIVTLQGVNSPNSALGKIAQKKLGEYISSYELKKRSNPSWDTWDKLGVWSDPACYKKQTRF